MLAKTVLRLLAAATGLVWLPLAAARAQEPAPNPPLSAPRYLIICLDGVPYSLVEEMHRRGELPHFQPPTKLLSSFPSLTDPALVEMLRSRGAPPSRGYEDYYFDPRQNRMAGGFTHRFRRRDFIAGTFRELFDYHPHPIVMTAEYSAPVLAAWMGGNLTLGRILKKAERSREPYFLAYLDATDPLAHLSGTRFLRSLLKRIDRNIPRLRQRAGGPLEVILFSDHGNDARRYRRAPLARALRRRGFRLQKSLTGPRSVVFPQYGLVGSAVLYTRPGVESEVAETLRAAEGVAAVAYREGSVIIVVNRVGQARLWRRGDHYCYRPESGDPLQLREILLQLAAVAPPEEEGCVSPQQWAEATQDHIYPDPVRRLWLAFEENVAQPASVVLSLEDGYYVGSRVLDLFAILRATHGSLSREQSLSFVLTTGEPMPPVLRGEEFWEKIELRLATAHAPRPWDSSRLSWLPAEPSGSPVGPDEGSSPSKAR